eukprot:UN04347
MFTIHVRFPLSVCLESSLFSFPLLFRSPRGAPFFLRYSHSISLVCMCTHVIMLNLNFCTFHQFFSSIPTKIYTLNRFFWTFYKKFTLIR